MTTYTPYNMTTYNMAPLTTYNMAPLTPYNMAPTTYVAIPCYLYGAYPKQSHETRGTQTDVADVELKEDSPPYNFTAQ